MQTHGFNTPKFSCTKETICPEFAVKTEVFDDFTAWIKCKPPLIIVATKSTGEKCKPRYYPLQVVMVRVIECKIV